MKRFLRRLALPLVLLLVLVCLLDPLFTTVFRHGKGTKAQWMEQLHGQHYEVAVIGSSRAWWNVDMHTLDTACHLRTINLANNHFTPAEMLLCMKVFLANGNRVDRLLIQVDHSTLTEEGSGFSSTVYDFVPYLDDSLVYEHLRPRSPEWFWLRHVPFWCYAKYNFKWGLEPMLLTALDKRPVPFDSTGSYYSPSEKFYGKDGTPFAPTGHALSNDLRTLLQLCTANDIEPVLFTSPYYGLVIPPEARTAPARVLAAAGYTLHDFSDSLPAKRYFNDNKHLNRAGGARFTRMLVEQVVCKGRL